MIYTKTLKRNEYNTETKQGKKNNKSKQWN